MVDKTIRRVAITGINGFVGKHIAKDLLASGYIVCGCSLEQECAVDGVQAYNRLNITDEQAVHSFFKSCKADAVVHLAALVHQKSSNLTAQAYDSINTRGSANVFQSAAANGAKAILFASTVEVYGDAQAQIVDERAQCHPNSAYGISKLAAEHELAKIQGVRYAAMRFAPVYAKEFTLNIDKRIYIKPHNLAYYFKKGDYSFSFCSIKNIVLFVHRWLEGGDSGTYIVSDEKSYCAREIIGFEKQAGRAKTVLWLPYFLAKAGIGTLGLLRKILGKAGQDSFFNSYNFSKLFISRVWDSSKARALMGDAVADIQNTLYNN